MYSDVDHIYVGETRHRGKYSICIVCCLELLHIGVTFWAKLHGIIDLNLFVLADVLGIQFTLFFHGLEP